jgi:hypothetical protein
MRLPEVTSANQPSAWVAPLGRARRVAPISPLWVGQVGVMLHPQTREPAQPAHLISAAIRDYRSAGVDADVDRLGRNSPYRQFPQYRCGYDRSLIECVDRPGGRRRSRWSHPSDIEPKAIIQNCMFRAAECARESPSGKFDHPPISVQQRRRFHECVGRIGFEDVARCPEIIGVDLVFVGAGSGHDEHYAFL